MTTRRPTTPEVTAQEILDEILDRLVSDTDRPVPYYRVRELCPPFSKPFVFTLLREGKLRGVKLGGVLLIERQSLEELLKSAEPWRPNGEGKR